MAEPTTAETLQKLIDILRPPGNSSGQDPEGKTKGVLSGSDVPKFVGSFADLGKSFEKLSTKLEEMARAVGINTDAVKQIPAAVLGYRSSEAPSKAFQDAANAFGTGVGNFVRHIDQLRQEAQRNSNVGIGDGDPVRQRARNQAAGYEDNAAGLRGVTDAAGNFKSSLAGAGYGANDASQKFLDFAATLRQEKAVANLINKNIISAADVPKLAQIAAQGQTSSLDTPESRKKLAEAMAREAEMINRMSSAYGISRDKLIDNAIAMNDNTDSQIRQGALANDAERRALRTAKTISMPGGAAMIDLVEKLTSGSRLSKADRAMLSVGTMGMGGQLASAVNAVKQTADLPMNDPRKIAAEEKLAGVQAEIRARLISPEAQRQANSMKEGPMRDALVTAISDARLVATAEKKIRDTTGVGYAESAKIAQQNIGGAGARGELTQTSGADKPKAADGAKVFQTVSELTEAYSKNAAAATVALAGLNEQLGKNAEVIDQVKKVLTLPVGPASESVKDKAENIQKPIDAVIRLMDTSRINLPNNPRITQGGDMRPVNVTPSTVTVTGGAPAQQASRLNQDGTINKPVTRGTGTLGETGFPAEMKDVVAKLHKGETVLTPEQMKNLISGAGMMSASDTASAMLASMTGTNSANRSGGLDITKIFDSVSTNISSASKPESITSDIIYTGTLKALKEINSVVSPEPVKSESKTSLTTPVIPPVKAADVKAPVPTAPAADVKTPQDSGVKQILDNVFTTISSLTGGGSTTRKFIQNEDLNPAQALLGTIIGQYNNNRAASSSKISESMGADTKNGGVFEQLRLDSEVIGLETRIKSMASDLFNRIGAGANTETTFESGIQRGNIVEKSTTSVPITDAMKGFEQPLTENTKEERDQEPQAIDRIDSELKTKDLYDQLIQLNSSIRQLVDHSASGVDLAGAQIKATRGLSGNRFA